MESSPTATPHITSRRSPIPLLILLAAAALMLLSACKSQPPLNSNGEPSAVRFGYFPNLTHAQGMIGIARGDFQNAAGPDVKIIPQTFNAGTTLIEAIYAGHVDIAYVGPSPALNGFIQSGGEEIRVIAGSARNGVTILANANRDITKLEQLEGRRIATPQFGNTQDISARYFLGVQLGFDISHRAKNGTAIIPAANPDIETLLAKDELDAAWVPEPWASRMIHRGTATEIMQEKELWPDNTFIMTCLVARRQFLNEHPALVTRLLRAHITLTRELQQNHQQFHQLINDEIERITSRALDEEIIANAMGNIEFSHEPHPHTFQRYFKMGQEVGIYGDFAFDVNKLIETGPLNESLNSPLDSSNQDPQSTSTQGNTSHE